MINNQSVRIISAVLLISGGIVNAQTTTSKPILYGLIDLGYEFHNNAKQPTYNDNKYEYSTIQNSKNVAMQSGMGKNSRFGIAGRENINADTHVIYRLEAGISADTGESYDSEAEQADQDPRVWSRQSYVGIQTKSGTVVYGRVHSPQYTLLSAIDPFGLGSSGTYSNMSNADMMIEDNKVSMSEIRPQVSNAVVWSSPIGKQQHYTFIHSTHAGTSMGNDVLDESEHNQNDLRLLGAAVGYQTKSAYMAASLMQLERNIADKDQAYKQTLVDLGGVMEFNGAQIHFLLGNYNTELGSDADKTKITTNNILLGLTVPIRNRHRVKFSYTTHERKVENGAQSYEANANQFALGYNYALSEKTSLYASYATITNSDGAMASVGSASTTGVREDGESIYTDGISMGMQHQF